MIAYLKWKPGLVFEALLKESVELKQDRNNKSCIIKSQIKITNRLMCSAYSKELSILFAMYKMDISCSISIVPVSLTSTENNNSTFAIVHK